METIKKYKIWYYIFGIIGLYGFLDMLIGSFIERSGSGIGNGAIFSGFIITYAFLYLFGTNFATFVLPFTMIISSTWFIWLGVSALLLRRIKKIETSKKLITNNNQ